MKEISYQIFDKVSGLPIETLSDKTIREFAFRFDKSCSEIYQEMKDSIEKEGLKYMIPLGSNKIKVVAKSLFSACAPSYYETYEDALQALK